MKKKALHTAPVLLILIALSALVTFGCSSRNEAPTISEDSTFVYLPKHKDDLNAGITFCTGVKRKTGERIGKATLFYILNEAKVYAFFDIDNREYFNDKELMFHIEWIDPDDKTIYRKRIDLLPGDSSSTLSSSISVTPDKRQPGNYQARLFLFRELIAEKNFELRNYVPITGKDFDINGNIILYRKIGKKTGKIIGEGTVFTIKKNEKVHASIEIENRNDYLNRELKFSLNWIGPDSNSFYSKEIILQPGDSTSTLTSSISITPKKRHPGNYICRIYLYKTLIAEKKFVLQ
jgi:hypothetical protein